MPSPKTAFPEQQTVSMADEILAAPKPTMASDLGRAVEPGNSGIVDMQPNGPIVVQPESQMQRHTIASGDAALSLTATNHPLTMWYHEQDGTVSVVPSTLDDYYGRKRDFLPAPTALWRKNAGVAVKCPVTACGDNIRIQSRVDAEAMVALGFQAPTNDSEIRTSVLEHIAKFHQMTFAELIRSGQVKPEEAAYFRHL